MGAHRPAAAQARDEAEHAAEARARDAGDADDDEADAMQEPGVQNARAPALLSAIDVAGHLRA